MRPTEIVWWCSVGHRNVNGNMVCPTCVEVGSPGRRFEKYAQARAEQRAVVFINPKTGERRTPPRADQPMPEVYAQQGFERVEITSMVAFERETGLVHEDTNYNSGNEVSIDTPATPNIPARKEEVIRELVQSVRQQLDSGPLTGLEQVGLQE